MGLLLTNEKLGPRVRGVSIPAVTTCPGASGLCSKICYTHRYTSRFHIDYSYNINMIVDFPFMLMALRSTKVDVIRIHTSGDFFSKSYIENWIQIVRCFQYKTFYGYTRSWRVPELLDSLQALAAVPNVRLWASADRETGMPPADLGWPIAWLMEHDQDPPPSRVDLVFRNRRHSFMHHAGNSLICPHENGLPEAVKNVTCTNCRRCFR